MLTPGSILNFSAGSTELNPDKFRILENTHDRLGNIIKKFPMLLPLFSHHIPIIINSYPTSIGSFPNAIFIDTYLRWQNFSRGLLLAHKNNAAAIIIGQPLPILDLLLQHQQKDLPLPEKLLIGVGGYHCPLSLENVLNKMGHVIHGYGVAEIEANCLVGFRDKSSLDITFHPVLDHVTPEIKSGELFLNNISTGDYAELAENNGIIIRSHASRLDPAILADLNTWHEGEWKKRTGYVAKHNGELMYQLRKDIKPTHKNELLFFDFANEFGFSWLDKPNWGRS